MKNNSQQQVLDYLSRNPMATETQIQINVWNYFRNYSTETIGFGKIVKESNKKYADLLRRALHSGKIDRVLAKKGNRFTWFYFIPKK